MPRTAKPARAINSSVQLLPGTIYDYPAYYELVFGSDWKAEFDFFEACFRQHARRPVRRLFEPACGTGRLLIRFAKAGYSVSGLDLNTKAIDYCNQRFARHGYDPPAFVADMTDFKLKHRVDAAFNPINSFRELLTEQQAVRHLECMADCICKGGLYILALHLIPTRGSRCEYESWSARRGHLGVISKLRSVKLDLKRRREYLKMIFDIYTPTRRMKIEHEMVFRTYTFRQILALFKSVGAFEIAATYDFTYRINQPIKVDHDTEDVVFVLRRR